MSEQLSGDPSVDDESNGDGATRRTSRLLRASDAVISGLASGVAAAAAATLRVVRGARAGEVIARGVLAVFAGLLTIVVLVEKVGARVGSVRLRK